MKSFSACFADVPDPRAENALDDLRELLFMALLATLCGATTCSDMALFARTKAYLLDLILDLKHGFPSHDTFSPVFRMLDPQAFERSFRKFTKEPGSSGREAWLPSTARRCGGGMSAAKAICRRSW